MSEVQNLLSDRDLSLTESAHGKMAELMTQIEDEIAGVRVYATPGGCSGISFGMSFTDQLNGNDSVRDYDSFKVIVDDGTMEHLRGVEIDFVDRGNGEASFVFNNLQPASGGGCGTCGSAQGGGCS
ncbi:MAG: iron-sulfur cluster assembly accessory protein [Pseudomonadota bacterium]